MVPNSQQDSQSYERRDFEKFPDEGGEVRLEELGNLELNRTELEWKPNMKQFQIPGQSS